MEALYGFDSGRSKRAIADNRKLAEDLKDNKGFVFAVSFIYFKNESTDMVVVCQELSDSEGTLKRKGIYSHPIIQKVVNKMWFKNKRDEGIMFPNFFNPISVPSIALILTAVRRRFSFLGLSIKF